MNKCLIVSFLLTVSGFLFSQNPAKSDFRSPLNIPLFLSGNFGELRMGHFHAGIDLKTQGVIGKPVFAATGGYVSRIKIQSGGYGKSLYITHPNGYTTVYAHLDNYIPEIESYVIQSQYNRQAFEIELFPPREMFFFKRGELIANSGNTGSSGGPHLHFEIRKTNGQIPVNVLKFNLPVKDRTRPEFRSLCVYSYSSNNPVSDGGSERTLFPVVKMNDSVYIVDGIIECTDNYVGFGAEVYDFLDGSLNRCGIYMLQLKIEGVPRFMFQLDAISFANTRYVCAHMDYELKIEKGMSVHRLFRLPNNMLPIYSSSIDNGLLYLSDDSLYNCEIVALDVHGNFSSLIFTCRAVKNHSAMRTIQGNSTWVDWKQGGDFALGNHSVHLPPKALYQDSYLIFDKKGTGESIFTDTLVVHKNAEPVHLGFTITIKLDSIDDGRKEKLLLARLGEKNKLIAGGGEIVDNELVFNTRNFGTYVVVSDTIAPVIRPLNFRSGAKYAAEQKLTFKVEDNLSGVRSYNAYINKKWALLEFDAKSGTLTYTVDPVRLKRGRIHELEIIVDDNKNNRSKFSGRFEY